MKLRILSCFLIFALCFSMLSACGSNTAPSDHSPSSSLQTEISDSQDSTPVEPSETDPAGTSDDDSSEGEAEPSQVVEPATPPDQQAESSAPAEITTASRFSTSDVPAYSGKAYTSVNGNVPYFSAAELTTQSFETYGGIKMEYNKLIAEMSLSDEVEGFYVLKAAYPKTTATGKPFLSASLSDRSDSIEIKVLSMS